MMEQLPGMTPGTPWLYSGCRECLSPKPEASSVLGAAAEHVTTWQAHTVDWC